MIIKINPEIVPYDNMIRSLCVIPYRGHSKGCINFNKKDKCPLRPLITEVLDFSKELYLIYTVFPIGEFAERMRKMHPEWKELTYNHEKNKFSQSIINRLKDNHKDWPEEYFPKHSENQWNSSRRWYNPRIWQETPRKKHRDELEKFVNAYPDLVVNNFPEAHGINLTGLMY